MEALPCICHVFTIVCKERDLIDSDTETKKKKGKKVLPNVEDRTLAVRLLHNTGNRFVGYIAPT